MIEVLIFENRRILQKNTNVQHKLNCYNSFFFSFRFDDNLLQQYYLVFYTLVELYGFVRDRLNYLIYIYIMMRIIYIYYNKLYCTLL